MNFILRDNDNKVYQTFWAESEEREQVVCKNIIKIREMTERYLNINDVSPNFEPEKHLGPEWTNDQGLYDGLVIKFNQLGGELLNAWNTNL